jgi:hypothetical protein
MEEFNLTEKQKMILDKMIEIHPRQFGVYDAIELFGWKSYYGGDLSKKFRLPFYKIMAQLEKKKVVHREWHKSYNEKIVFDDFSLREKYKPKKV